MASLGAVDIQGIVPLQTTDTKQDSQHEVGGSDVLCLTCGSAGGCVSVFSRLDNTEPLLTVLGHTLRRPLADITLHTDVVCTRCHAHFGVLHRLMTRLARLAHQTSHTFNRAARWFEKRRGHHHKGVEEECLLVVEGVEMEDSEGGIVGRALAMAPVTGSARTSSKESAQRKYECPACGKKFRAYSHRVEHMLVHTGERAFQCGECGFQATTKSNLTRHKQQHIQVCRCHLCGKTLANKFSLKEHLKTHSGVRPHQCSECGKTFVRRRELRIHQRGHGIGEAKCHECPECHRTFVLHSRLVRHMLVHRQHKQFVCEVCKKEFARKDDLKCHERTHTGEKPYTCQQCGRAFRYLSNCRSHMRVHQRVGLSCTPCSMTFPTQAKYSTHLRSRNHRRRCEAAEEEVEEETVTGATDDVTKVQCGVCGATFDRLDQLSSHTLSAHITPPVLPDTPETSIIISGMGEDRVVSFSQLEGVSVVVEVDRDSTPLPMSLPQPSPPSTALLSEEPPPPSPALLPFTLDGKEVEGVGGTILASLTDGEEMVVCAREEEVIKGEVNTSIAVTTSPHSNTKTITVSSPLQQQPAVTIINTAPPVFKLADWDTNE